MHRGSWRVIAVLSSLMVLVAARPEAATGGSGVGPVFRMGERALQEGRLSAARGYFASYLRDSHTSRLMDAALFKLGRIASSQGDYPVALRYFDLVQDRFKHSGLVDQAKLKGAYCQFRMGSYRAAVRTLDALLSGKSDPAVAYEGAVLLGRCWREEGELGKAVDSYKRALTLAPENLEEIRGMILKAIDEEKDTENLLKFSRTGVQAFPYGDALHRALSLFFEQRNYQKFMEFGKLFLQRFPDHPGHAGIMRKLTDLETQPERYKTKIGVLLPLTGSAALQGDKMLKGIQLALSSSPLAEVIDLIVKDSAGDPLTARETMKQMVLDPGMIAMIGPAFSTVAEEVAPIADQSGLALLSPASTFYRPPKKGGAFFFRNSMTPEMQGRAMAEFAVNRLNLKRFAIIYPDDRTGGALKRAFAETIDGLGGEIVTTEDYSAEEVDFTALIKKMGGMDDEELKKAAVALAGEREGREMPADEGERLSVPLLEGGLWNTFDEDQYQPFLKLGYDAIFIPGLLEKISLIIPQLEFFNIVHVKLLGGSEWNSEGLTALADGHPRDFFFVDGFNPASASGIIKNFVREFRTFYGETPDILAAQSYDAANILLRLYKSGKTNRASLRLGLLGIRGFPGVSGRTSLLPSGDADKELSVLAIKRNKIVEAQTVLNGKLQ